MWRGSLIRDGCTGKPGWFPADHVVLIDTGMFPIDTGTVPIDAGTVPIDTGTVPIDTSTVLIDTGTVPRRSYGCHGDTKQLPW